MSDDLHLLARAIWVWMLCLTSLVAHAQTELRAGVAKAVITPDVHKSKVYLAGFGHNRVATGVHDDLYVRCLALSAGTNTLVVCSVDVIGLFYEDVLKIRRQVNLQAPGISYLIVSCTHVHEGPDTLGLWGPTPLETGIREDYLDWLDLRIADTAVAAARSAQAAHMELARDDHPLLGLLQSVDRPPFVKDPHLFVMRLTAAVSGATIGTLVNWSDHPETLGRENREITADYPHWLCQYVESHLGGTAVFVNGSVGKLSTLGKQVALQDPETGEIAQDQSWKRAELIGTTVGQLVERALGSFKAAEIDSIAIRKSVLFVPLQNDRFRIAAGAAIFADRRPLYTEGKLDRSSVERDVPGMGKLRFPTGHDIQTEVGYVQFRTRGHMVAEIATVPGEIYPELTNGGITRYPGADFPDAPFEPTLRAHLKSKYQFVFGLDDDEIGYLIPKAEWDDHPPWLLNKPESWYGETNSAGPDAAGSVLRALATLIDEKE